MESIRVSQKGNAKIGKRSIIKEIIELIVYVKIPLSSQTGSTQTSADLNSLGKVMSQLMKENKETLELPGLGGWLAEAIEFLEATSTVTPLRLKTHHQQV